MPLARKQRKPLLRGVLNFMTTEREHSSLIGTYVRVPRNRVSEIKSFRTRLFDNISERRRTERLGALDAKTEHSLNCGQWKLF